MRKQQQKVLQGQYQNEISVNDHQTDKRQRFEEKQNALNDMYYSEDDNDSKVEDPNARKHQEAKRLVKEKQFEKAAILYRELIASDQSNFDYLYDYANVLRRNAKWKQCAKYYEMAIAANSQNAQCFYEYGKVLHRELNNMTKAVYQYEKCIKLSNGTHHDCLYEYAQTLQRKKKNDEAAKYYKKAISELIKIKDKIKNTVKFDQVLAKYKSKYGLLLRNEKNYAAANEQFTSAMKLDPTRNEYLANYAYSLFLSERYKEAEEKVLQCLEKDSESGFINHVYALLLRRTNRFPESFVYHQKAVTLNPKNAEYKRRYDEFLDYSNRFTHEEKQKMKRKFDKATAYMKTKNFEKARKLLKDLATVNPYNIVYVFKNAFVLHRLKLYQEAEKYYKLALTVEGDHSICHFDYGLMLSKLRRTDEAEYHYKRCIHMNPLDWICRINYARLLEKKGQLKDAAFHLEQALTVNPNDNEARQLYNDIVAKCKVLTQHRPKAVPKREPQKTTTKSPWGKVKKTKVNQSFNEIAKTETQIQKFEMEKQKFIKHVQSQRVPQKAPNFASIINKNTLKVAKPTKKQQKKLVQQQKVKAIRPKVQKPKIYCAQDAIDAYQSGNKNKARNIYSKLVEQDSSNYDFVLGYARMLFQCKEFKLAQKQYLNALDIRDDDDKVYYELSMLLFQTFELDEAANFAETALNMVPDNVAYNYHFAMILERCGNYEDAFEYFEIVNDLHPNYKHVEEMMDKVRSKLKQNDQHRESNDDNYDRGQPQAQDPTIHQFDEIAVMQAIKHKNFMRAKELLMPAMESGHWDNNFKYLHQYAHVLFKLSEFRESEHYFKMALLLQPNDAMIHQELGTICEKTQRDQQALMYLEKAVSLNPTNVKTKKMYNKMVMKLQQKQMQRKPSFTAPASVGIASVPQAVPSFGSLFGDAGARFDIFHEMRKPKIMPIIKPENIQTPDFGALLPQKSKNSTPTDQLSYDEDDEDDDDQLIQNSRPLQPNDFDEATNININTYLFGQPTPPNSSHSHLHRHIHHHHHVIDDAAAASRSSEFANNLNEGPVNSINLSGIVDDIFPDIASSQNVNEEKTIEESQHQSYCQKRRRTEFKTFLLDVVQFPIEHFEKYMTRFIDEGLADIRLVHYFDEQTLSVHIGMSAPHQKLLLDKLNHFRDEKEKFRTIFSQNGIPTKYANTFGDYGILTVEAFCRNFEKKSDLKYILEENDQIVDQIWTAIENYKNEQSATHFDDEGDVGSYPRDETLKSPSRILADNVLMAFGVEPQELK